MSMDSKREELKKILKTEKRTDDLLTFLEDTHLDKDSEIYRIRNRYFLVDTGMSGDPYHPNWLREDLADKILVWETYVIELTKKSDFKEEILYSAKEFDIDSYSEYYVTHEDPYFFDFDEDNVEFYELNCNI